MGTLRRSQKIAVKGYAKTPPPNNAPVFDPATVSRSVAENTAAGQNVGAVVTATDADTSDTLGYTLGGADAASFDIVSSSGQIQTKTGVTYDHEAKASYAVTVTASDGTDTATATVTISVTDVNEPPAAPAAPAVAGVSGSTTSLTVSWTAPANTGKPAIASYDIQYRQGTSGDFTNGPQDVNGTSATITSLVASTLYQVQVRATNDEGDSAWSALLIRHRGRRAWRPDGSERDGRQRQGVAELDGALQHRRGGDHGLRIRTER